MLTQKQLKNFRIGLHYARRELKSLNPKVLYRGHLRITPRPYSTRNIDREVNIIEGLLSRKGYNSFGHFYDPKNKKIEFFICATSGRVKNS